MLRLTISVKNLKEIADLLNTVVTEAKFKIDAGGISVIAVDPAHVAMISINVPKDVFSEFQTEGEEEIALDVERLKSVIRLANSNDMVSLAKEKEKLKFEINNIVKSISLLDNSTVTTPRIPQINSEFFVVLGKTELERGLKAAEDVSDSIKFSLTSEDFRARSSSDSEESEMVLTKDMIKEIQCSTPIKSSYPLEYLLKLVKSLASTEELKLSFKDDYPLTIEFNFGQGKAAPNAIKGSFLLAPRMEQ
ncbi:MAG: DNA polymerase sliding clamp [Candidatus Thermoplasmatota archaeon]|jgi:proliferating cell nuclear antigen|nr:DNA polymerase sliding clamp [Candidatus Thermoplasmatota archaeon]MCL5954983.1 DNA polymerase sliding clamp [Candidatus Thermoplasmatota archaeon]